MRLHPLSCADCKYKVHTKIKNLLRDRAYLVAGLTFHFIDENDGDECAFYFEGGIKSLVAHSNRGKDVLTDVVYIKKALSQLKQYNSRQILERYVEEWCNTMRLEKNELKKMNAGRKQANMFLTNLLIKH